MSLDFSTIDLARLTARPVYKLPPSYHLQKDSGNGCFMDPPGFPTYFTRSVYTQHSNNPRKGSVEVIEHEGRLYVTQFAEWPKGETWESRQAEYQALMRRLWKAPPLNHPRVIAWIRECYRHFANCYAPNDGSANASDTIIAPPPGTPGVFDGMCSPPSPEKYRPFTYVREFYPEHVLDAALALNPPKECEGEWWETDAEKPTPETCAPRWSKHPMNITWCQWCGWHESA